MIGCYKLGSCQKPYNRHDISPRFEHHIFIEAKSNTYFQECASVSSYPLINEETMSFFKGAWDGSKADKYYDYHAKNYFIIA